MLLYEGKLIVLSKGITVVDLVPVFDTLPAYDDLSLSESCTSTISPGLRPVALIEVEKLIVSFSFCSLNSFHFPNLCACPLEVQPKANCSDLTILPVSAMLS